MAIAYEGFGNVLTHKAQTITCPVNTVGIMGSGLAMAMRNRIQGLHHYYKNQCEEGLIDVGVCTTYKIPNRDQQVLLFPSKKHWKEDSKIEDIESGLKHLVENIETLGITELAMVPVGCGLGKLDYNTEVKPLLYKYLDELEIPVYILHRQQG